MGQETHEYFSLGPVKPVPERVDVLCMTNQRDDAVLIRINRRWTLGMVVSVAAVIAGIVGTALARADVLPRPWAYASLVVAIVGAATALGAGTRTPDEPSRALLHARHCNRP